ncbi:hypothetical protein V2J09_005420 [Rumex salicifolius]
MSTVVSGGYCSPNEVRLTLNSDSFDFPGGDSLYRIIHRGRREIHIIDSHNKTILTLRHKVLSLRRRWDAYAGQEGSKPVFSVRRSAMIGPSDLTAKVYENPIAGKYRVKRFSVYDMVNRSTVAAMQREEDKFVLRVMPASDCAFAVALAVVFDRIGGGGGSGGV